MPTKGSEKVQEVVQLQFKGESLLLQVQMNWNLDWLQLL